MSKKTKYYVVWEGARPGIYERWEDCQAQIMGYPNAKYKSFEIKKVAEDAFKSGPGKHLSTAIAKSKTKTPSGANAAKIIWKSISVDAACSGNPGIMEYRGVNTQTKQEIFRQGPFPDATNNIGEFLALVHCLALLQKKGDATTPIYSDSRTALAWVRNKKAKTELELTARNAEIFDLIARAENWLKTNVYKNPILKWETEHWGEIPADFGRK